ncbi:hypothetical protein [Streptomyces zaomyceticus]|uniref:hypothetical protein n=1 Tax=Streptomyces zaomyceticus TaxID=68286 RepID=UPI0036AF71AD
MTVTSNESELVTHLRSAPDTETAVDLLYIEAAATDPRTPQTHPATTPITPDELSHIRHHLTPGQALQAALHTHPIPPTELDLTPAQLALLNSRRPDTPGWKKATADAVVLAQEAFRTVQEVIDPESSLDIPTSLDAPIPHSSAPDAPKQQDVPTAAALAAVVTEATVRLRGLSMRHWFFKKTLAQIVDARWSEELGDKPRFIQQVMDTLRPILTMQSSDSLISYVKGLSPEDEKAFRAEVENIRLQKRLWGNVRPTHAGCNDNGTWGTSAGGAGGHYEESVVNAIVFARLKAWWLSHTNHTIEPSLTSGLSLIAQRSSKGLSPKLNYHLLIRIDSENRIVNRWERVEPL